MIRSAHIPTHIETLERRQLLAGVTLITHGFGAAGSSEPGGWMREMARVINSQYAAGAAIYGMTATDNWDSTDGGTILVDPPVALEGLAPNATSKSEVIVLLDWSQMAGAISINPAGVFTGFTGHKRSTVDVAAAVFTAMAKPRTWLNNLPLAALPMHLIGHSRGGSLVTELAYKLGQQGAWVDQVTTLDPHPVDGNGEPLGLSLDWGDSTPKHWANITYFNDYWRQDNRFTNPQDFIGQPISEGGAYNRELVESVLDPYGNDLGNLGIGNDPGYSLEHSDTHAWYHGTVRPGASNGAFIPPSNWYGNTMPSRTTSGYYFSRIAGGTRSSEGLWSTSSVPVAVTAGSNAWDNIIVTTDLDQITGRSIGDAVPISYVTGDGDGLATVTLGFDNDQNPFNANPLAAVTRTSNTSSATLDSSSLVAGTPYYVFAKIKQARERIAYATGRVVFTNKPVTQVAKPSIAPNGGSYTSPVTVSMSTATTGATIRYTVNGTEPTESSAAYTGPFALGVSAQVRAKAFKGGLQASVTEVANFSFTQVTTTGTPVISPAGGSFTSAQFITLTSSTPNAVIRYTLDGSEPTWSSNYYYNDTPIVLTTSVTLKAKAFSSTLPDSATSTAVFSINITPNPNPPDLTVIGSSVQLGATTVMPGGNLGYNFTIYNSGSYARSSLTSVYLRDQNNTSWKWVSIEEPALESVTSRTRNETISIPANLPLGNYRLQIVVNDAGGVPETNTGNNSTFSPWFAVSTSPPPTAPIVTYSPANGAVNVQDQSLGFNWSNVTGASRYDVFVAKNPADLPTNANPLAVGPSIAFQAGVMAPTTQVTGSFDRGTTYHWVVRAVDANGYALTNFSSVSTFTTAAMPTVTVVAVQPNAYAASGTPAIVRFSRTGDLTRAFDVNFTLGGTAVRGVDYDYDASSLRMQAGQASVDLTIIPLGKSTAGDVKSIVFGLTSTGSYTAGSPTVVTCTLYEKSNVVTPSTPTALTPGGFTVPYPLVDNLLPTLTWAAATNATGYQLSLKNTTTGAFVLNDFNVSGDQTSHTLTAPLEAGAIYTWAVRATNGTERSAYSANIHFGTPTAPPPTEPFTLQAETAVRAGGTAFGNNHAGYQGTGFADYGGTNSSVTFDFTAAAGPATLALRYANGGTADRPLDVYVNGVLVGSVSGKPTGGWPIWGTQSLNVTLATGTNSVRLVSTSANGVNLDSVTFTPGGTPPPPPTGTLSGFTFDDKNANGVFDGSDVKTSGKTVFLDTDNDGVLDSGETSVKTANDCSWSFVGLVAGAYRVRQVLSTGQTYSTPFVDATLAAGQVVTGRFIGTKTGTIPPATGSISGFAFDDKNKNGKYDAGEVLAAGKTIWLDLDDDGVQDSNEASKVTDSSGKFSFTGLTARTYHVRRKFPTGYLESTTPKYITLTPGQVVTGVSIGGKPK